MRCGRCHGPIIYIYWRSMDDPLELTVRFASRDINVLAFCVYQQRKDRYISRRAERVKGDLGALGPSSNHCSFFCRSWCFTSTETIRLIRVGRMEVVGEEGDYNYTCRGTVTVRMTPALRWAAMRAILMFP